MEPLHPKKVHVKMDIEGSEFTVLSAMMEAGLLCEDKISTLTIEVHEWLYSKGGDEQIFTIDAPPGVYRSWSLRMSLLSQLRKKMEAQSCKSSALLSLDDELYLHDTNIAGNDHLSGRQVGRRGGTNPLPCGPGLS